MLVNKYDLEKAGVAKKDVANFMSTLRRLTPTQWRTFHDKTPIKRGKSTYTVVRSMAHYDLDAAVSMLQSRIKSVYARPNHIKMWKACITKIERIKKELS